MQNDAGVHYPDHVWPGGAVSGEELFRDQPLSELAIFSWTEEQAHIFNLKEI